MQVTPVKDKSVSFYVSLAKRALLVNESLELSGVGTVCSAAACAVGILAVQTTDLFLHICMHVSM